MRAHLFVASFVFPFALAACSSGNEDPLRGHGTTTPDPDPGAMPPGAMPPGAGMVDPATCGTGKAFAGFDGENLVADRVVANVGVDRGRFKPYDALAAEYTRVLGATPASLAGSADTFGKPDPRWYDEPAVGGVVLQTSFAVAFDGCLTYTAGAAELAAAPTPATASVKCAAMERAFWSRTPSPDQITACSDVAVNGAAGEPDPRRRWAYACASVLNAAGFMTY